ncbi:MAG: glycosyltransferase [Phycisphaerales bacterium]|nr:MAG: glycosyltransferase [Phycisphaerales bacterium]
MRIVFWGTYDTGKPRNRILLRGLRQAGVDLVEIRTDVWGGVEDKGQIAGAGRKLRLLGRWLAAYPGLVWRYLRAPRHDAVLVGYMGHLDVILLWPFAKLRGAPVAWDAFLSLYNTVVEDRRILGRGNPVAWFLFAWEWLACRAARLVVLDTGAHAAWFSHRYGMRPGRTASVMVGAEQEAFPPCRAEGGDRPLTVLFYGQFTPLHGIGTIVRAAQAAHGEAIRWVLIGTGQEAAGMRALLAQAPANVEWIEWVPYDCLREHIARADVCLGVFGDTGKAARVIPNKVFQILSAGAPLITRDSPAIRELLSPDMPGVWLVPPADPDALLDAVRRSGAQRGAPPRPLHRDVVGRFAPEAVGAELREILGRLLSPGDSTRARSGPLPDAAVEDAETGEAWRIGNRDR